MLSNYREAQEITTISRSNADRLVQEGKFPAPIWVTKAGLVSLSRKT